MITLRVSNLEALRYHLDREGAELPDLLARLREEAPPTPAMEAGKAFAKVMETIHTGEFASAQMDGWKFVFAIDEVFPLPLGRELEASEVFKTPHGPVKLVGHCDGITGYEVHDQKLTERFDAERYADSLQWRAYLLLFGARRFVYDVFTARYHDRVVTVCGYDRLPFYAYPDMRRDVQRAVNAVAEIAYRHGIGLQEPAPAEEERTTT